jgi:hypothetical protein
MPQPQSHLVRSYKMTRQYTVEENGVIWYEENGVRVSFSADPANSDYQRYLNPEAEQSTPIDTGDE